MPVVEAYAKVVVDDSGFRSEIPVLLAEQGVVTPCSTICLISKPSAVCLGSAMLSLQPSCFCNTWKPISVLLRPSYAFSIVRIPPFTGTVGDDGLDPSGLYWIPASTSMANRHISALKGLTDYLADHEGVQHMVPLVTANSYDQRLSYAAWYRRNQNDFLGHIKDKTVNDTIQKARNIKGRRTLSKIDIDADAFPESLFERFFIEGIGGALDRRCAVRDQLIMIMMHGAGLRESEPLHLWVQDVQHDPHDLEKALVRVYHPEDGRAPDDWKSQTGKTNRSAYLRENYALPPRNKLRGTKIVGWKVRMHDHPDYYVQMHWFPSDYGRLFLKLWREHLFYLVNTERHHPYAFISYEQDSLGQPYTLNAFNKNYAAAMARIGLSASKIDGLSPHGHRHAYGRRLASAGVDPIIRKKRFIIHHLSLKLSTQPLVY